MVDGVGNVFTAAAPASASTAWKRRNPLGGYSAVAGLSCPTSALCVGYDNAGNILASTHPAGRRSAWKVFAPHLGAISSLTCTSNSFCFGLAGSHVLTSRNPAAGARAWNARLVDPANTPTAISCPSASLCVVVESNGNVATSTDPTNAAGGWQVVQGDTAVFFQCGKYAPGENCDPGLDSVSCPSASFCAAADYSGNIITSSDPTAGVWTLANVDSDAYAAGYIICASPSLCVKYDSGNGTVRVSHHPKGGAAAWTTAVAGPSGNVSGATCASKTRCLASDSAGNVINLGTRITATNIDGKLSLTAACFARGLCVAYDPLGNVLTSPNPLGGRRTWKRAHVDADPLTAAACPSITLCVAADGYGNVLVGTSR